MMLLPRERRQRRGNSDADVDDRSRMASELQQCAPLNDQIPVKRTRADRLGRRAANERAIDALRRIEQIFMTIEAHNANQVARANIVESSAVHARVHESTNAGLRDHTGVSCGDRSKQLAQHALRPVVGLDAALDGELAES